MVYSKTEKEHHDILTALFQRLQEYGFMLREEKCNLLQRRIKYLAHIVDESGLRPDPAKIESIVKMPPPSDITGLRSFLGAVNFYGKFVSEMHQLRKPLDALLKKNAQFVWNNDCQKSFQMFKEVLQSDLLLTHFDPSFIGHHRCRRCIPIRNWSLHYAQISQRRCQSHRTCISIPH